jgi:hypothetical protein
MASRARPQSRRQLHHSLGKIHDARTVGDKPVKVLATYVVEKGKPLATPAP